MQSCASGVLPRGLLDDGDTVRLLQNNLIVKREDDYYLNFACFTQAQFAEFAAAFSPDSGAIDDLLAEWLTSVRKSFERFVPERLYSQINQWISCYAGQVIGCVTDELIGRGLLNKPNAAKPHTDGVFFVEGDYINP